MSDSTNISSALEDYLEAMLTLQKERGKARVSDIANLLSVHKSTVTAALKALAEKGLIDYVPYGSASLKSAGRRIAERVAHDHQAIREFLVDVLQVSPDVAEENACRMEHVIDRGVLDRLVVLARQIRKWSGSDEGSACKFVESMDRELKDMR